jgi:hydrogenase expression/formation protein HypD
MSIKYINDYRDKTLIKELAVKINHISVKKVKFMEICGGHTVAIHKFGLKELLPDTIELLSGPGCPVCVSDKKFIDQAIAYADLDDVIVATFGDLIRVPGSFSTLAKEQAKGADIRIVYSPNEALEIAKNNASKKVVFLGIGFETTAPTSAATIINAKKQNINNFYVYSTHKIMPPAMAALIDDGIALDGYICPGHVSAITGTSIYEPFANKFRVGCVISGFEPLDLMQSIYMLVKQIENDNPKVETQYIRAVKPEGNLKAQVILDEILEPRDDYWRGFGIIPKSGLGIKKEYRLFDAEKQIKTNVPNATEDKGCICGEILKGLKTPANCPLFSKFCNPANPVGACMVSNEGACAAYYKYKSF